MIKLPFSKKKPEATPAEPEILTANAIEVKTETGETVIMDRNERDINEWLASLSEKERLFYAKKFFEKKNINGGLTVYDVLAVQNIKNQIAKNNHTLSAKEYHDLPPLDFKTQYLPIMQAFTGQIGQLIKITFSGNVFQDLEMVQNLFRQTNEKMAQYISHPNYEWLYCNPFEKIQQIEYTIDTHNKVTTDYLIAIKDYKKEWEQYRVDLDFFEKTHKKYLQDLQVYETAIKEYEANFAIWQEHNPELAESYLERKAKMEAGELVTVQAPTQTPENPQNTPADDLTADNAQPQKKVAKLWDKVKSIKEAKDKEKVPDYKKVMPIEPIKPTFNLTKPIEPKEPTKPNAPYPQTMFVVAPTVDGFCFTLAKYLLYLQSLLEKNLPPAPEVEKPQMVYPSAKDRELDRNEFLFEVRNFGLATGADIELRQDEPDPKKKDKKKQDVNLKVVSEQPNPEDLYLQTLKTNQAENQIQERLRITHWFQRDEQATLVFIDYQQDPIVLVQRLTDWI